MPMPAANNPVPTRRAEANDTAPDGGAVVLGLLYDGELIGNNLLTEDGSRIVIAADGSVSFTPGAGFTGQEIATYRVRDADGSFADATVTFRVEPAAPPVTIVLGKPGQALLRGGDGNDVIVAGSARGAQAFGDDGADVFVFGLTVGDGVRDTLFIRDFEAGVDLIDIGDNAFTLRETARDLRLILDGGDGDTLIFSGIKDLGPSPFTDDWTSGVYAGL